MIISPAVTTFEIGTPVVDPYGTSGFISAAREPESRVFIIGAGMQEVRTEYEVCFDSGRISVLSDGIVAPFVNRATHLPKVENVEERKASIRALQDKAQEEARQNADEGRKLADAFRLEAKERTPDWAKAVIVAELVEDRSDVMTDYFGSTTKRTVILGFSKHARDLFPELRKFAEIFPETAELATAPDSAEHREKYSMGAGYYLKNGWRNSTGWQVRKLKLYNGAESVPMGEWNAVAPVEESAAPTASVAVSGIRIEEHTHTKKGFRMFIAILPDRVERDEFDRLRDVAEALGGWYSRPWGRTPGGFAFKDLTNADTFANPAPAAPATDKPATVESAAPAAAKPARVVPGIGDKLRDLAERLQGEIDSKFANRLTNTPKRQREADSARLIGYQLERTQQALLALAGLHDAGNVPPLLAKVTTKARAFELMRSEIDRTNSGYYDAGVDTGKPALNTPEALALWDLVKGPTDEEKAAEELRRKLQALQFANIPGYFPTPSAIVADMIEAAEIPEGAPVDVLEPEAGSGAILEAIRAARPMARLTAYETHSSLRDVLKLKAFSLAGSDFLEAPAVPAFDYVLMNPPFETGQDMAHVRHAFAMLRPGGRLVAIMSPGPFLRSDSKAQAFRAWFDDLAGEKVDIPAGAFKESGTGVATVMITLCA